MILSVLRKVIFFNTSSRKIDQFFKNSEEYLDEISWLWEIYLILYVSIKVVIFLR